jgi:phage tail protein X
MKKGFLKIAISLSLLMGMSTLNATEDTASEVTHGTPWINVRLPYSMTVKELAGIYYGSSSEANVIVKANRGIRSKGATLRKNMTVRIPVTANFSDQPERLGWVQ